MQSKSVSIERIYNAPVEKVWKALTDKEQMQQWYFTLDEFRAETGFEFSFKGQGHKGEQYIHLCKILEVVPLQKLSYSWTYEGYTGYSVVTFELFAEGDKTRLKLTHQGLESFPQDNADFASESFTEGWNYLTGEALKTFVEKE